MLYLHEIIDIVGTGQAAYMQTVVERAVHSETEGISRLVGCWKVIGSTNRWPRVVNLWEMDSWAHWAETLERQFVPEKRDAALAPWWAKATEWRSGGFDRILEPARFSPDRATLVSAKIRSWVSIHTIARAHAGKGADYLSWVAAEQRPVLESQGLSLFGAYTAPMRSDEIVVIWSAPDFRHACRLFESSPPEPAAASLTASQPGLLREFETMWLVPAEECFFHARQPS